MKQLSKSKIKKRAGKKTNPALKATIAEALKHPKWIPTAKILSSSTRKQLSINLDTIEKLTSAGDTILVPGKVLSQGNLTKKVRIVALSISQSAREKLKPTKSEFSTILREIKSNAKFEGVKLIN